MSNLGPPISVPGHVVYSIHAQTWSSKFQLSTVRDSAESSWALFRTALSQAEYCPGQRWVRLSTVPWSSKLWKLGHVVFLMHANLDHPNFGAWSMMYFQTLELGACCISYTCHKPWFSKIWSLGHVVYFTHAQPWSSKFWRLGHVVYFTHAQPCSSKFWSLRHVIILNVPRLDQSNYGAWGMLYILHMPTLDIQNLELGHVVYFKHAQPWSSKFFLRVCSSNFGPWSMLYILHMPSLDPTNLHLHMFNSALQRLELRACCIITHTNLDPPNLGTCCIVYPWSKS